jgi:membrane associated rhomboid family serine protease
MNESEHEHDSGSEEWLPLAPVPEEGEHSGAPEGQLAELWALVLESRYLPCRIERTDTGLQLLVPAHHHAAAVRELTLFRVENLNWPPVHPPPRPLEENTLATLSVILSLATFHNITLLDGTFPGHPALQWSHLGSAHAGKILDGEWWRLITPLTLHADSFHLAGNLAIGGCFVYFLSRELGSGLSWSLLLGAGMLGNLANALLHRHAPNHDSIGASTAVFGAIGIFAALSMVRFRHHLRRWPLPAAAALALLATLGVEGQRTDLGAHFFGLLSGLGLGALCEYLTGRYGRPRRLANALLALAATLLVTVAWWRALSAPG